MHADWIEDIFGKMILTYGQGFLRRYDGIELEQVKANWLHELGGVDSESLQHALKNLPSESAPTVLQFRDLCKGSPKILKALPAPSVDPRGLKRITAQLQKLRPEKPDDPRGWAYRLKERDERGKGITSFQRRCYREALGLDKVEKE